MTIGNMLMDLCFDKKQSKRLFFISALVMLIGSLIVHPFLPAQIISSSFNLMGSGADAPRQTFLTVELIFLVGYTLAGYGIADGLIRALPESINIPNKDFWLDPSRLANTLERVSAATYWLLFLTNILIWVILVRIYIELITGARISVVFFPAAIAVYLVLVFFFWTRINQRFKRP